MMARGDVRSRRKWFLDCSAAILGSMLGPVLAAQALAADTLPKVASRPALMAPQALHTMLLGGTRAGCRLVAVGLHGIILLSDDNGVTWRQVPSPTSVTLTGVAFADAKNGWAIGHLGTVLHTVDGGENWVRQLDGVAAAALALEAAQKAAAGSGDRKMLQANLTNAQQLVSDGPDKPFLDIAVSDRRHALIVGAYGIAFSTADAGVHWLPVLDHFDDGGGLHIYALASSGTTRYAAGEQGLFMRSLSGGPYQSVTLPASLSVFGLMVTRTGRVIAYGLDGLFEYSDDEGSHWTVVKTGIANSLTASLMLSDGKILVASQIGQFLVSADNGTHLRSLLQMSAQPVAGLILANDGAVITLGTSGAIRLVLDKTASNS